MNKRTHWLLRCTAAAASAVTLAACAGGLSAHTGAKNRPHVTTAKLGLVGFTRGLAHDLADAR